MFCRQCGTRLNEGAGFCPQCGMPTASGQAGATPPVPVDAPAAGQVTVQPAEPTGAPSRGLPGAVIAAVVGIVVLLVLVGAFVGLYFTGMLEPIGLGPQQPAAAREAKSRDASKPRTDDEAADDEATEPASDSTADDGSYATLADHYDRLWRLHTYLGVANADGSYGGTGFAYEVFNAGIGSPDYAVREQLVSDCQAVVDAIAEARAELADAEVDDAYADQKDALLGLYDLLVQRIDAMLGAATIAVDSPDESSWRPTLSPASADARRQFEEAYPTEVPEEL